MDDKFILMGLNDENSKEVAEILKNKTAKKIIDFLGDRKEASEKDISESLNMPINTVEYNIKKLVKVGLVKKDNRFFWSEKGKKINLYQLARKHIIISPNKKPSLDALKAILPIVGVIAIFAVIFAIVSLNQQGFDRKQEGTLQKFSSYEDLKNFLENNIAEGNFYGDLVRGGVAVNEASAVGTTTSSDSSVGKTQASDYSETNIQVEGVDEPDIVKNDGKYIYVVSGKKVVIADAYPAEEMEISSEIDIGEYISNIFVNDDKLVLFAQSYEYFDSGVPCDYGFSDFGVRCGGYSKTTTKVFVYDISDRENPRVENEFEFDGNYVDSRMIDNLVYVISSEYIDVRFFELPVYNLNGVEKKISAEEIYHFNAPDENYVFNTISAIDLEKGKVETETYLMGSSSAVYVSQDNIYLTYQKQLSQKYYFEKYVEEVLLEVLPYNEREEVREIMESDVSLRKQMREISEVLEDYQDSLDENNLFEFLSVYKDRNENFYREMQKESEKTIIYKISVDGLKIDYQEEGEVPGRVLNQFSMDEFDGYFRIATTTGQSRGRADSLNHLYVLNKELEIIGSVEDLARGEQIYSARFIGDKAYIVTFRQVDPLFVIDLSNPEKPEVLGELKITGYSGYLHPYDETHLIGIGMEATEQGRVQGVKVSLFDVSDYENPKEIDSYEIAEGEWSSSDAIYDYKAVLFDKEKNLLVIPVSYNREIGVADGARTYPIYDYWQGAFVFDVSLGGIELRGKVSHQEEENSDYYWRGNGYVRRSLFMDDVLYTISDKKIKASDILSVEDINELELPYEGYDGPVYVKVPS